MRLGWGYVVGGVGGGSSEAEGLVRRKPRGLVFCCFWACLSGGCLLFLQCVPGFRSYCSLSFLQPFLGDPLPWIEME